MNQQTVPVSALLREHQNAMCSLLQEFDRICRQLDIPYVLFAGSLLGAVRHEGFIPWDDDLDVLMLRKDYRRFLDEADSLLDREKFFLQKEFSDHWPMFFSKLRLNGTACIERYHPKDPQCHQGVYMDIFPCDDAADTELGRRIQFLASKVVIAKALDKRGYDTRNIGKKVFMAFCRLLPDGWFLNLVRKGGGKTVHSFFAAARSYRKNVYPRHLFENRIQRTFEGKKYPISAAYDTLLTMLYGDYMELPSPEQRQLKQHAVLVDLQNSYEHYSGYLRDKDFDVFTRSIR